MKVKKFKTKKNSKVVMDGNHVAFRIFKVTSTYMLPPQSRGLCSI